MECVKISLEVNSLINGLIYKNMIIEGAKAIESKKNIANDLNVFPVPDGDTGTNMSLTMLLAMNEMSKLTEPDLKRACDTASNSLLRGARGNSGVILSLLFRGVGNTLKEYEQVDGTVFAAAFKTGVETAYKAVMKPAEGTILTVSRVSADSGTEFCKENPSATPLEVINTIIDSAKIALTETQFQNPILEKAGVVDAGAYGYIEILGGMRDAIMGITNEYTPSVETSTVKNLDDIEINFTYCTEFIAQKVDKHRNISRFKAMLEDIGDSIVVVDDDEIVKVHLHTDNPDKVLAQGLMFGPLITIKIENMREQHSEVVISNTKPSQITKEFGFVSVASGDGLVALFKDLGVDYITIGGQTMNPSTDDLILAINNVPASNVFILPNNKNIIMAAQQAAEISDKNIVVIPTHTVPQGISALISYDANNTLDENINDMTNAAKSVRSGQITYAARDSEFDDKSIKKGEFLALSEGKLVNSSKKITNCITSLADVMTKSSTEFITIITGEDSSNDDEIVQIFKSQAPDAEITVINGGQPVYYYIVSAE